MQQNSKATHLLGIANKAGALSLGSREVRQCVRKNRCYLVILSEDAGYNTHKSVTDKCNYYNIKLITWGIKEELGKALGRKQVSVIGIKNKGIANRILDMIQNG